MKPTTSGLQLAATGRSGDASAQWRVLQLLSAHDLKSAAMVAAASGHPRLATLVATAGLHEQSSKHLAGQVASGRSEAAGMPARAAWDACGFFGDQDGLARVLSLPLEVTYKLLAGNVAFVLPLLRSPQLSWQRAFALCVWFGAPPDASLASVLQQYEQLTRSAADSADGAGASSLHASETAPPPLPAHAACAAAPAPTVDAQYSLLQLAAAQQSGSSDERAQVVMTAYTELACTRSYSGDALDAVLPWMVLCLLRAAGALPSGKQQTDSADTVAPDGEVQALPPERAGAGSSEMPAEALATCDAVFASVTVACADSLLLMGEPLWAVYVLLHVPVPSAAAAAARAAMVRSVLAAHWPIICEVGAPIAKQFLCEQWGVPQAWLAAAQVPLARQCDDTQTLVLSLHEAGQDEQAERVLVAEVAPTLMSPASIARLGDLCGLFEASPQTAHMRTLLVRSCSLSRVEKSMNGMINRNMFVH